MIQENKKYIFGEWVNSNSDLSLQDIESLLVKASSLRQEMADYPLDNILRLLGRVQKKWADPKYSLRKNVEALLPAATHFSPEMVKLALDELISILDPAMLQNKINTEFLGTPRGAAFDFNSQTKSVFRWHPLGVVLHVLSGNVFMVGPGSLIEGLLTGNVNILKNPSSETIFLTNFVQSIKECDEDGIVSRSIAILDFHSSETDKIELLKKRVDGLVVFGGEEAVKAYRRDLPANVKLIEFGPKMSLSVCTESGMEIFGQNDIASKIARDISLWDQNACTAAQAVFFQTSADNKLEAFVKSLAEGLQALSVELPPGEIDIDTAVEIQKLRSTAEIMESRNDGRLLASRENLNWTVVLDKKFPLEPSPLHRTIRIIPYKSFKHDVLPQIDQYRGYVQSIGLCASPEETSDISIQLGNFGILRIVETGKMHLGEIDDPHDGAYDLPKLMNLVKTEFPTEEGLDIFDVSSRQVRNFIINERLRRVVDQTKNFPLYFKTLKDLPIRNIDDLKKAPLLEKGDFAESLLQAKQVNSGGYVTKSGGSTGTPKYSYFDKTDWHHMVSHAVKIFRASGLKAGDRLANCLFAGEMYGSFLSFDHTNYQLGVTSFGFADKVRPEDFLAIWKRFSLNAIQGFPPTIMPLLRKIHDLDNSFSLETVVYAGQPLSQIDFQWLKSTLKARRVASIIGTTEAGEIGYQCEHLDGTHLHHLIDDYNFIEILDDQGSPVPDGEAGWIVITTLMKFSPPLIRYKIGDKGKILNQEKCRCGRNCRTIEYLGRGDDILCIGTMNLSFTDIENALHSVPITELQLVAKQKKVKSGEIDLLVVNAESETKDPQIFQEKIKTILISIKDIRDNLDDNNLVVEVNILKPGSLKRNPANGKIKRIIDERI